MPSYTLYDTTNARRLGLAELVGNPPPVDSMDALVASPRPAFIKTHELPAEDDFPAIYIARDGRDALVSYAHYALNLHMGVDTRTEADQFGTTLRDLVVSTDGFGSWSAHVLAWVCTRKISPTVVRFEDLIVDPVGVMARTLACLPAQLEPSSPTSELPSFSELHELVPRFFRRGIAGAWRDEMPPEVLDLFWQQHGAAMQVLGYGND